MRLKIDETLKHLINRHIQATDACAFAAASNDLREVGYWVGYLDALNGLFWSVYRVDRNAIEALHEYRDARKQRTIFE